MAVLCDISSLPTFTKLSTRRRHRDDGWDRSEPQTTALARGHKGVEMELLEIIEKLFLELEISSERRRAELLEGWEAIA
nr:hypothetical protein Iba_chr03cCG6800 [Ipomoea batatas]